MTLNTKKDLHNRTLVYGMVQGSLVFIQKQRAHELAELHKAINQKGIIRKQFRDSVPDWVYEEVYSQFSNPGEGRHFQGWFDEWKRDEPNLTHEKARKRYLELPLDDRWPEDNRP